MYELKECTEKVGLRIHPRKTKVLSNQSSISPDWKKEMQIGDVKIEILTRSESVRYLRQLITFQHQEPTEIKNHIRAPTQTPTVRRSNNSDDILRIVNMGTHQSAWKNVTIAKLRTAKT